LPKRLRCEDLPAAGRPELHSLAARDQGRDAGRSVFRGPKSGQFYHNLDSEPLAPGLKSRPPETRFVAARTTDNAVWQSCHSMPRLKRLPRARRVPLRILQRVCVRGVGCGRFRGRGCRLREKAGGPGLKSLCGNCKFGPSAAKAALILRRLCRD
jgi:hypothetical protein